MLKKIPYKFATITVLLLLTGIMIFHFLVLIQIIPFNIVWGGKLKTLQEMYRFEMISLLVNSLIIGTIAIKAQYIKLDLSTKIINGLLYLFIVVFALNTIGNIFAEQSLETIIFTPMTAILAILLTRIVIEK
jgi:hypothetical protein